MRKLKSHDAFLKIARFCVGGESKSRVSACTRPQKTLAKTAGETKAEKTGPQAKFVTTNNTYCITHSFWERKNDSVPRNGV